LNKSNKAFYGASHIERSSKCMKICNPFFCCFALEWVGMCFVVVCDKQFMSLKKGKILNFKIAFADVEFIGG
jgi:hypothetical protein